MAKDQSKKVGGGEGAEKKKQKSSKKTAFAGTGHKVAMPVGFSFDTHKAIKSKDFDNEGLALEHKAAMFEYRGNKMIETAKKMREKAKLEGKYDSKTKKSVKRALKAQEALAKLSAELSAAGVNIADLLASAKKEQETAAAATK